MIATASIWSRQAADCVVSQETAVSAVRPSTVAAPAEPAVRDHVLVIDECIKAERLSPQSQQADFLGTRVLEQI
ncbi:hypothetical protein AB0L44_14290 [Nonomuraea wenchangensis]|uniref:hypothetical protein n=1 Tax=Nonomuraea wenchangensis TaxID=568860 RepID=UPI00343D4D63